MKLKLWIAGCLFVSSGLMASDTLSMARKIVYCGDAQITFLTTCAGEWPGVQFIHLHENERTSVEAAGNMLERFKKGCFVTWQSQGDRYVRFKLNGKTHRMDPNRIYSPAGRRMTLSDSGSYTMEAAKAVKAVADHFLENYVKGRRLLVAFHNNTEDGGFTIHGYEKGGDYARDAKLVYTNPGKDEDDFFYTTELKIFNYIKAKGFNVVLQENDKVTEDGSLSVYAAKNNIPYLNLEAQHGHLEEQLEMIALVQDLVRDLF